MIAPQFPDESRVWIYTANRKVDKVDQEKMSTEINSFLDKWAAHGSPLLATSTWLNTYQLAVVLDENQAGASGCSIDSQTRFIRDLGAQFHVDWFDRLFTIINDNQELKRISFFDLGDFPNALLHDPLVQQLGELRTKWPIPMLESRYKTMFG